MQKLILTLILIAAADISLHAQTSEDKKYNQDSSYAIPPSLFLFTAPRMDIKTTKLNLSDVNNRMMFYPSNKEIIVYSDDRSEAEKAEMERIHPTWFEALIYTE